MLGSIGGETHLLDAISLHLTSDRAKERQEAIQQLRDFIGNRTRLYSVAWEKLNNAVAAFFKMLGIEFKYVKKEGEQAPAVLSRLKQLVRDAKAITNSIVSCGIVIVDTVDPLIDMVLDLFKTGALFELYIELLSLLNCLFADPVHLRSMHPTSVKKILYVLERGNMIIGADWSSCLLHIATFFFEINGVPQLQNVAQLALSQILRWREAEAHEFGAILNILRSFATCVDGLVESHPIFCRSLLKQLVPAVCEGTGVLNKRRQLMEELVRIFNISWPCLRLDQALCVKIAELLCNDAIYGKYKFENINPMTVMDDLETSTAIFLLALSKYAPWDDEDRNQLAGRSGRRMSGLISVGTLKLFACCIQANVNLSAAARYLALASPINQKWCLVGLAHLANSLEDVCLFALKSLSHPILCDAAAYYLNRNLQAHAPDLTKRIMSNAVDSTVELVQLLHKNFLLRYRVMMWCRSAQDAFTECLECIRQGLLQVDTKHCINRLILVTPSIVDFIMDVVDQSSGTLAIYKEVATRWINELLLFLANDVESETKKSLIASKLATDITPKQADIIIDLPLILLSARLGAPATASPQASYAALATIAMPQYLIQWLLPIVCRLCTLSIHFQQTASEHLIGLLIKGARSRGSTPRDQIDAFGLGTKKLGNEIMISSQCLVSVFEMVCKIEAWDDAREAEAIKTDLFMFTIEHLENGPLLPRRKLLEFIKTLAQNTPAGYEKRLYDFLNRNIRTKYDVTTILSICQLLHSLQDNSTMVPVLRDTLEELDIEDLPLSAKRILLPLKFSYSTHMPKFLQLESNVELLSLAEKLAPGYLSSCVKDLERPVYDSALGLIHRLKFQAKDLCSLIITLGKALQHLSPPPECLEVRASMDELLSTPQHRVAARRLLSECGLVCPLLDWYLPTPDGCLTASGSFVRWEYEPSTASEGNFANILSRVLLDHFQGRKEKAGQALVTMKERLGQNNFELLFKTQFFKVLAHVTVLSNSFSIPFKGKNCELTCKVVYLCAYYAERDDCITQLCANVKISQSAALSGVYLQLLVLELLVLLEENPLVLLPVMDVLASLSADMLVLPVQRRMKCVFSSMLANTEVEREKQAITSLLGRLEEKIGALTHVAKEIPPLGSIPMGLADSLYETCSEVETPLAIQVIRKIGEIMNNSSIKAEEVPEKLQFAIVANYQSPCRSILKCLPRTSVSQSKTQYEFLHQLLRLCDGHAFANTGNFLLDSNHTVTNASAKWIVAQALLGRHAEAITVIEANFVALVKNPMLCQAVAFAFKYVFKHGKLKGALSLPMITMELDGFQMGNDAINVLYLVELFGVASIELYGRIYTFLQESSYSRYVQCQSDDISFISAADEAKTFDLNQLQERIDQSFLFTQNWSIQDVSSSFDPSKSHDDHSFLQLRAMWLGKPEAGLEFEDAAIQLITNLLKLDLDCKAPSQIFINETLATWIRIKKAEPNIANVTSQLRFIKALDRSASIYNPQLKALAQYVKAEFLWKHGSPDQALRLVNQAISTTNQSECGSELVVRLLLRASKWSWQLRCKTAQEINKQLLEQLAQLTGEAKSHLDTELLAKSQHTLARFYDQQYERLRTSDTLHIRRRLIRETDGEISRLEATTFHSSEVKRTLQQLQNQLAQDRREVTRLTNERVQFALKAATFYSHALQFSSRYDLTASRLCSLFFALRRQPDMLKIMSADALPVSKFVPLIYQLASRAELVDAQSAESQFQTTLQRLLLKALINHPHHALYPMLALRTSSSSSTSASEPIIPGAKRRLVRSPSPPVSSAQARRSIAAATIITQAKTTSTTLNRLIGDTERLRAALIELASVELAPETSTKVTHPFEPHLLIKKLSTLSCPVPTATLSLDATCSPTTVQSIIDGFRVVGGINLPKIIEMIGSDGNRYRLLIKGRDDLRQDAVMEQIFSLVNRIFQGDSSTRHLRLRTFRVIPLQPLAGILEWIADAIPIGDYLHAAHERFYPTDLTPRQARSLMRQEFEKPDASPVQKIATFRQKIVPHFHPVLGLFFHETTSNVTEWYTRRRQYILSTAVASMVGHIVGLGDRHCQNLMLDVCTGELIHIDLNMIFEAGHGLRIPELVPFRLTRDIIHAMGALGVEAAFSTAAALTMHTLRERTDPMLLIMEVFKYDPLHRWASTVLADKGDRLADSDNKDDFSLDLEETTGVPKEAERALLRVKEKLQGWEEGTLLSERGQVTHLINVASDLDLLAQMYYGWQAWM